MDKQLSETVERFRAALENAGIRPERGVLFGSRAVGTAHEHSDYDLAVVSGDFRGMNLLRRFEAIGAALAKAGVMEPVEAIPCTPEEFDAGQPGTLIADEIKARGVRVL